MRLDPSAEPRKGGMFNSVREGGGGGILRLHPPVPEYRAVMLLVL